MSENNVSQPNEIERLHFPYLTHWYGRNLDLCPKTQLILSDVSSQKHLNILSVASRYKVQCQSCKLYLLVLEMQKKVNYAYLFRLSKLGVCVESMYESQGVSTPCSNSKRTLLRTLYELLHKLSYRDFVLPRYLIILGSRALKIDERQCMLMARA